MMDDQDLLVAEEIRWEMRGHDPNGAGACNCQPGGNGPPCPHGNFDISYKVRITDAERAIELLKDWKYEGELTSVDEEQDPGVGPIGIEIDWDETTRYSGPKMQFNDMTGEWEEV